MITSGQASAQAVRTMSLPEDWSVASIGELFKFSSGKARPKDTAEARSDDKPYPVFGGNGVMGFAADYLVEHPTLVIGRVGVYCGCAHHTDGPAWISDNALHAKWVSDRIETRWARSFLEYANLNQYSSRAAQPLVSQGMLSGIKIPVPPKGEQRQIAVLLSAVQWAIERQERLIALVAELKKALMHKLFTEGTRGEPLKQPEIGPVPESWRVEPLGDHLIVAQYGLSVKGADAGTTPILRMTNQVEGRIVANDLQMVNISNDDRRKFKVEPWDILFNRTNSFELVGRTAIFDLEGEFVFASYLIRLRTHPNSLRPAFLNHYFNWSAVQARLKGIASRAVSQSNISASRLRGFLVPLPSPEEQDEIVRCIDQIDRVRSVRQRQLGVLQGLFRTLLHQLMTARIRVHDLDLSELVVDSGEAELQEVA